MTIKKEFNRRIKTLKLTEEEKEELYAKFTESLENGFLCAYCGDKMSLKWGTKLSFSIDHTIPRKSGGKDSIENLEFICAQCNEMKSNKSPDWFFRNVKRLKERKLHQEQFKAQRSSKDDREREAFKQIFQMRGALMQKEETYPIPKGIIEKAEKNLKAGNTGAALKQIIEIVNLVKNNHSKICYQKSKVYCWETPQDFFDELNKEFGFTLDVCANEENHKCNMYFTEEEDGLSKDWGKNVCWMNPPYGSKISKWVKKAFEESEKEATIVCLLPARTDTRWWWNYCMKGEIRFIKGRLKFKGKNLKGELVNYPATFPSVVVIFKNKWTKEKQH